MSWNYRILAHEDDDKDVYFKIHEVYYKKKIPNSYTSEGIFVGGESLKAVKWVLKQMKRATKKPILWAGEKFPQKFKKKL